MYTRCFYFTINDGVKLNELNIAMHLPESVANAWLNSFKDEPDIYSNPFIFTKKMEKKVFYIDRGNLK